MQYSILVAKFFLSVRFVSCTGNSSNRIPLAGNEFRFLALITEFRSIMDNYHFSCRKSLTINQMIIKLKSLVNYFVSLRKEQMFLKDAMTCTAADRFSFSQISDWK